MTNPLVGTKTVLATRGAVFVVLFASRPCADIEEWIKRFERYRAASGRAIQILTIQNIGGLWVDALPDTDDPAVLWDVTGGMPPKEIESMIGGIQAGEWRAGVRYSGSPAVRGVSGWKLTLGRLVGWIRKRLGKTSDPHPLCVTANCAALKRFSAEMAASSSRKWTSELMNRASRELCSVSEIPVMWAL